MALFKDAANRTWIVAVTVADIRRVKKLLDVNLYRLMDEGFKGLGELLDDPLRLVDVLFVLVSDQAAAQKVSDEDFGRALAGEAYGAARQALQDAFVDFFPEPQKGAIKAYMEAARVYEETVREESEKDMAGLNDRMKALAIKTVAEARRKAQPKESSSNVPASLVSILDPSHSASS